jgi:hypothetical protein
MKRGRPSKNDPREKLTAISVRLPAITMAAIDRAAAALPASVINRRATAVRAALELAIAAGFGRESE